MQLSKLLANSGISAKNCRKIEAAIVGTLTGKTLNESYITTITANNPEVYQKFEDLKMLPDNFMDEELKASYTTSENIEDDLIAQLDALEIPRSGYSIDSVEPEDIELQDEMAGEQPDQEQPELDQTEKVEPVLKPVSQDDTDEKDVSNTNFTLRAPDKESFERLIYSTVAPDEVDENNLSCTYNTNSKEDLKMAGINTDNYIDDLAEARKARRIKEAEEALKVDVQDSFDDEDMNDEELLLEARRLRKARAVKARCDEEEQQALLEAKKARRLREMEEQLDAEEYQEPKTVEDDFDDEELLLEARRLRKLREAKKARRDECDPELATKLAEARKARRIRKLREMEELDDDGFVAEPEPEQSDEELMLEARKARKARRDEEEQQSLMEARKARRLRKLREAEELQKPYNDDMDDAGLTEGRKSRRDEEVDSELLAEARRLRKLREAKKARRDEEEEQALMEARKARRARKLQEDADIYINMDSDTDEDDDMVTALAEARKARRIRKDQEEDEQLLVEARRLRRLRETRKQYK